MASTLPQRPTLALLFCVTPLKGYQSSREGLVFVTAFPSRKEMTRYLAEISWETEVWVADQPDHMIHFNGERFLGPYEEPENHS